jgi:LuxR family maltose regulon positive regulatory protein
VALLAQKRLSAKEIAEALFITESTVRSALKTIYNKLDIHSKAELAHMDL